MPQKDSQQKKLPKLGLLYRISMLLLSAVTMIVFVMTLFHVNNDTIFDGLFTAFLLLLMAVLAAVCLCFEKPKGNVLYSLGFYILHGGLVVLLCGFLLSRLLGQSVTVQLPVGEQSYGSIYNEADDSVLELGFYIGVTEAKIEYYVDDTGALTENPKHYEATVALTNTRTMEKRTESLTVNHPIRVSGNRSYKIYLMSFYTDASSGNEYAVLLMKSDPSEYTILTGIFLLIVGSVFMCYLGQIPLSKKRTENPPLEQNGIKRGENDA